MYFLSNCNVKIKSTYKIRWKEIRAKNIKKNIKILKY